MQEWLLRVIEQYGYIGVFLLIAIENIFPPIPSEVILTFSGFMTVRTELSFWGVTAAATAGSVVGALVLYAVGRCLSERRLEKLTGSRWGRALRFRESDVKRTVEWFRKKGYSTVFFCRFIPVVRSLISIPAGIVRMRLLHFLALSTAGTLIWNAVLVSLGRLAGASWETVVGYVGWYGRLGIIGLGVGALAFGVWYFHKRFPGTRN